MVMRRIFNKGHEKKNKEVSRTLDEVTKHRHEVNDFKRKESKLAKVATHDGSDMLPVVLQILTEIKYKLTLNPPDDKINQTKEFIDSASSILDQVRTVKKNVSLNPLEYKKTKSQLKDIPDQIKSGLTQLIQNSNRIEITRATCDLWQEIAIWLDGIYKKVADKAKKPDGSFRLSSNGEVDTIDGEDYAFNYLTGLTKFIIVDYYHQLAQSIERRINIFETELRQAQGPVTMPLPTTTNAQIALSLASTIKKENATVTSVESSSPQVLQNQTTDSPPLLEPAKLLPIPEPIQSSPATTHAEISPPAHSASSSPPPIVTSSELMHLHTQSLQVMHALRSNEEEKKELQSVLVENLAREREETQLTYSSTPSIPPELFNRELSEGTRYTSLTSYVQKNPLSGEQKDRFSAYKEFVLNKIGSYHTAKVSSYGVPRVLKSILPEVLQPFPHDKEIEDAILKIRDSDDTKDHIETIFTLWTSMVRQNSKKGKSDSGECLETACSFITGEKRP